MAVTTDENKGKLVEFDEPFVDARAPLPAPGVAFPKSPTMMRKMGKAAMLYVLSYLAVKALDKARQGKPDSEVIASVDEIAHAVFYFENFLVGSAVSMAKAGYDAVTKPQIEVAPQQGLPLEVPDHVPVTPKTKHHRNRANLNAKLLAPETSAIPSDSKPSLPAPTHRDDFKP